MKRIENPEKADAVVRKVYEDAVKLDWLHCSQRDRSEQYERWLEDKNVGKVLDEWMTPAQQRVWLKDGPLKEFARALAGAGEFAKYLTAHPRAPTTIVAQALGPDWVVIKGSLRTKPLGCDARRGAETKRLLWGPAKDFKHLLWASLVSWERTNDDAALIVVFDTVEAPLSDAKKKRLRRIASRANVSLAFIRA